MVRRLAMALIGAVALVPVLAGPAGAINYGTVDSEERYPYVGVLAIYEEDAAGNLVYAGRCSGSLLSPTVFLTAAHCTDGAAEGRISFDYDQRDEVAAAAAAGMSWADYMTEKGLWDAVGDPVPHPDWNGSLTTPNTHDVAVYELRGDGVTMDRYAELAPIGFLDQYATKRGQSGAYFTTTGYGLQQRKPYLINEIVRMYAVSDLISLRSNLVGDWGLHTTNNPGDGRGGNCSGDSGGPILWQDTDIVVAVNSFGLNNTCKGGDFSYRVDTAEADELLGKYDLR